jgi:hypothetical protein
MASNDLLLKFMESSIVKINRCLAHIHAIEQLLIDKDIVTLEELKARIHDSEELPERKVGVKVLNDMIDDYKKGKTS